MGGASGRVWARWGVVVALGLACVVVAGRSGGWFARPTAPVARLITGDAGDERATTTFDGPLVRKRAAIAIHPVAGADPARIGRELRAAAGAAGVGALTDATFAVFDRQMLDYLVPEMTLVLPEGTSVVDGEAFMRDHQPRDVAFYLVEPVLVHDMSFAVIPAAGVSVATAKAQEDREGILSDSLNHYVTTAQPAGLTVGYFGAILSDGQVLAVREAMGRAAGVPAGQVSVEPNESGPGVNLSAGTPDLADAPHRHG